MSPELLRLLVAVEIERIQAETPQPVAEEVEADLEEQAAA